jgi:hypothetical protein
MTRFVRNPDGAVHSVPDDFAFPTTENGAPVAGWADVKVEDASPQLLGEPDPQVEAVRLHTLAEEPVAEVVSSGHVGDDPAETDAPADEVAEPEVTE